jgi:hypothetical protein
VALFLLSYIRAVLHLPGALGRTRTGTLFLTEEATRLRDREGVHLEPSARLERAACRLQDAALPGELRRQRVLGAIRTHTAQRLMLVPPADWATRTFEPPSGADPDRPPYEGGAAAVRGGRSSVIDSEDVLRH